MKPSIIRIALFVFISSSIFSFIGYDKTPPPGVIEVIGDAGSPNVFTFNQWNFSTFEIPNGDLTHIHAIAEINTSSLSCEWKDLQKSVRKKKDYFYVKKFPTATVEVKGAQLLADGSYETDAMLTLKNFTKPVKLRFQVSGTNPITIEGKGEMKRQSWGFTGGGPKDIVPINFTFIQPTE